MLVLLKFGVFSNFSAAIVQTGMIINVFLLKLLLLMVGSLYIDPAMSLVNIFFFT